jgi:cytochrome P450
MTYTLFDTEDPAAAQGALYRDGETVYQDPQTGLWLVTGHQLVREVFRNTVDYSNDKVLDAICPAGGDLKPLMDALANAKSVVTLDPPEHGRIRTALDRVFPHTRDAVQKRWGGVVTGRVNEAVDALTGTGPVDLKPVCVRLSVRILCDVLGLSAAEHEDNLREWTDSFARLVWANDQDAKHADAANAAALFGLCQQIVEQRIAAGRPGPGVIGALIGYRDQKDNPLSVDELVSQLLQLVGAGW